MKLFLAVCLGLLGLEALAEQAPYYYAHYSVSPKFESKTLRTHNTNYFPFSAQTHWGLLKFSYGGRRDRQAFYNFGSRKPHFTALGQNVQSWAQILSISPSGRDLMVRFSFRNNALSTANGSHTLQFNGQVYVTSCDGATAVPTYRENMTLAERLESGRSLSEVRYCSLAFRTHPVIGANFRSQGESLSFVGADIKWDLQEDAIIVRAGLPNVVPRSSDGMAPNSVIGPSEVIVRYERKTERDGVQFYDKQKARKALRAAREYLAELTDYGDRTLLLSIKDAPSQTAFHESYMSSDKISQYEDWVSEINEGVPHLPAKHLANLHLQINQAYEYIRYYEQEVLKWRHNFFDELSERSLPD